MRLTAWRLLAIASLISAAAPAATRPHYGGTLRVQMRARVNALEPSEFAVQENLAALVFDRLVNWSESGQPQPALAISWRHDADFKRWEFELRPGVKFHDGSPLTAAIAATALERLGAIAPSDTLVIRSEQPNPKLLATLAGAGQSIWKRGADGGLLGTGPFRIVNWDQGRRAVFAANEDYWAGRPYLDALEIEMGRSPREQALDFDLNRADIVELASGDSRRNLRNGGRIWTSQPVDLLALIFEPGADERFREAVALSIDRATIHNVLLQKQGAPASAILPQWLSGYAFLFAESRNLEHARQIISGLQRDAPIAIGYDPLDITARSIAERIAVNAREVGLVVRPVPAGQAAAARMIRARVNSPDPAQALAGIAAALGLPSSAPGSPEDLYAQERAFLQSYRIVPLFHLPEVYGLGPRVRNWAPPRWSSWKLENVWLTAERP